MQGADPVPLSALRARCHGDRPCETVSKPTCDEMHHGYRAGLERRLAGVEVLGVWAGFEGEKNKAQPQRSRLEPGWVPLIQHYFLSRRRTITGVHFTT